MENNSPTKQVGMNVNCKLLSVVFYKHECSCTVLVGKAGRLCNSPNLTSGYNLRAIPV